MAYIPEFSELGLKIRSPKIKIKNPIKAVVNTAAAVATGGTSALVSAGAQKLKSDAAKKISKAVTKTTSKATTKPPQITSATSMPAEPSQTKEKVSPFARTDIKPIYIIGGAGGLLLLVLLLGRK